MNDYKKTIVHVITRYIRAGADENTALTALGQSKSGNRVFILHGDDFDQSFARELSDRITFVRVPRLVRRISPVDDVSALVSMTGIIKKIAPDIVHTHTSKAGVIGRVAAVFARVPTIVHGVHIAPFVSVGAFEKYTYIAIEKALSLITDAFVDVSAGMKNLYLEYGIGRHDNHFIVHSGFDLRRFQNPPLPDDLADLTEPTEGGGKPLVVLVLSALEPRKRIAELIEAFGTSVSALPDVRLLVAGEGSQKERLTRLVAEKGLERNVRLLGFRHDPERLIRLSDVCILVSHREGLPRVIMQYIAGGRPCIATRLPGIEEVIMHGVNGLLFDENDIPGVVAAVADLIRDRPRLEALAAEASLTDLRSWDVEEMSRKTADVYSRLGPVDKCFRP